MRKLFINMITFGLIGGLISSKGITSATGTFWVIIVCLVIIQINNSID